MAVQNTRRDTTKLNLCTEWMELESDPGLFTLLLEDIGVKGVKVEEVYDVTQKFEFPVYGYVFLFQWVEERRVRKKAMNEECYITETSVLKNMFFAHQIVTNSCATHALLSIMLNCEEGGGMSIGHTLRELKQTCKQLDPESRGYAIGNTPELAVAHNCHAKPSFSLPTVPTSKRSSNYVTSSVAGLVPDTYHFVSYVPIGERLFELDGLKQWPIDHGPWAETEDWTDLFKRVISKRLSEGDGIQFNLMALIPDPVPRILHHLQTLQTRQKPLLDLVYKLAQQKLTQKDSDPTNLQNSDEPQHTMDHSKITELVGSITSSLNKASSMNNDSHINSLHCSPLVTNHSQEPVDLDSSLRSAIAQATLLNKEIEDCKIKYKDEMDTRKRYKYDAQRRTHDYNIFFEEYFKALAMHKLLPPRMLEMKKTGGRKVGRKGGGTIKNRKTANGTATGSQRNKHILSNGTH